MGMSGHCDGMPTLKLQLLKSHNLKTAGLSLPIRIAVTSRHPNSPLNVQFSLVMVYQSSAMFERFS